MKKSRPDWKTYYQVTRHSGPSTLLVEALHLVPRTGKALDIGAGALNDTRFLLDHGFTVCALDNEPLVKNEAARIKSDKMNVVIAPFEKFDFPKSEYDLVNAMLALPYISPEAFGDVFLKIKQSVRRGGVFCAQFFDGKGDFSKHPWASRMTFHNAQEIVELTRDMQPVFFTEEEHESTDFFGFVTGRQTVYNLIALRV